MFVMEKYVFLPLQYCQWKGITNSSVYNKLDTTKDMDVFHGQLKHLFLFLSQLRVSLLH